MSSDAKRPLETAPRDGIPARDTESPSHQRPPYADPLAGGDPTAPGAPHEPGGVDHRQSEVRTSESHAAHKPDRDEKGHLAP